MILGIPIWVVAIVATTLIIGAAVQGLVGLGLGLVAAPIVTLLEPSLMPTLLVVLGAVFPFLTLVREHHDVDWRGLAWMVPARIPGTWLGVALLSAFSSQALGIAVALMVLAAVAVTWRAPKVSDGVPTLLLAGFVSGTTSTTSAIGGPPVALVYQSRPAPQVRSTLAVYFILGSVITIVGLALSGHVHSEQVVLAAALAPTLVIGLLLARALHRWFADDHVRSGVLIVCAASAVVLLVKSLAS